MNIEIDEHDSDTQHDALTALARSLAAVHGKENMQTRLRVLAWRDAAPGAGCR